MAANILVGRFFYGHAVTPGWTLTQNGARTTRPAFLRSHTFDVHFHAPFASNPVVVLGINHLEVDMFDPGVVRNPAPFPKLRYSFHPENISPTGFQMALRVWDATKIWYIGGIWTAYAQGVIDAGASVSGPFEIVADQT